MTPSPDDFLDPVALDRSVERAFRAHRAWKKGLFRDPDGFAEQDPFGPPELRKVATKTAYDAVAGSPLPFQAELARWIGHLVQARLTGPMDVERAGALHAEEAPSPFEAKRRVSYRRAWRGIVEEPSSGRALAWLDAAATLAPPLATIERERDARRDEVWRRLGHDGHPAWSLAPLRDVGAMARAVLDATEDLAQSLLAEARRRDGSPRPTPVDALREAMARDATSGWPARLTARWLSEIFGTHVAGLSIDLGPLPDALGGASFARALARFGYALRTADPGSAMPFVLRRDPHFVDAHRVAATFGALVAAPAFHRRVLGLGERAAAQQTRTFARALLFTLRVDALRALAAHDARAFVDAWDEWTARAMGAPLPRALAGAWPRRRDDEAARFYGAIAALDFTGDLVERFDEDWFRNPRAFEALRARGAMPASATAFTEGAEPPDTGATATAVVRAFEGLLG